MTQEKVFKIPNGVNEVLVQFKVTLKVFRALKQIFSLKTEYTEKGKGNISGESTCELDGLPNTGVPCLEQEMQKAGFALRYACYVDRIDDNNNQNYFVRFIFQRADEDEIKEAPGAAYGLLDELCTMCIWRDAFIWMNSDKGGNSIGVLLIGRNPLFDQDGFSIEVWNNKALKDYKVILEPENQLVFVSG